MPNSSAVTLIWRRSVALIVPSWIGTSYCFPVRLSVIVSVSAIARHVRPDIIGRRLPGHVVAARQPPSQVGHPAAFAAEWLPRRVRRFVPAVDAPRVEGGQTLLLYIARSRQTGRTTTVRPPSTPAAPACGRGKICASPSLPPLRSAAKRKAMACPALSVTSFSTAVPRAPLGAGTGR